MKWAAKRAIVEGAASAWEDARRTAVWHLQVAEAETRQTAINSMSEMLVTADADADAAAAFDSSVVVPEELETAGAATAKRQKIAGPEKKDCLVCYGDLDGVHVFLPCRHGNMCLKCSENFAYHTDKQKTKCPKCRTHIECLFTVFTE